MADFQEYVDMSKCCKIHNGPVCYMNMVKEKAFLAGVQAGRRDMTGILVITIPLALYGTVSFIQRGKEWIQSKKERNDCKRTGSEENKFLDSCYLECLKEEKIASEVVID